MAADVQSQAEFRTGKPHRLFRVGPRTPWAITGDHRRVLIAVRVGGQVEPPLKVVTRWTQSQKR